MVRTGVAPWPRVCSMRRPIGRRGEVASTPAGAAAPALAVVSAASAWPAGAGRQLGIHAAGPVGAAARAVAAAVDVTLLGRFYERFADHAVEVGRRVIFLVTGKLPEEPETTEKVDNLTSYPDL